MDNIFEFATRRKLRFPFKGQISVEDLWDLSVKNLDEVFKVLNTRLKNSQEESLLSERNQENDEINIQIEIVKYIVSKKLDESKARQREKEISEKKQQIMEIISAKQNENLHNMPIEDLQKMLGDLTGGV